MTGTQAVQALMARHGGTRFQVTGPDWGECTAVPHSLQREILGLPIVYGNAKDIFPNAPESDYIKLAGNVAIEPGDIVVQGGDPVLGTDYRFGHVFVATAFSAPGQAIQGYSQNYPTGREPHVRTFPRNGLIGALRAKVLQSGGATPMAEVYAGAGIADWNREAIRSRIYAICGADADFHTDPDIRQFHQGKTIPQIEDQFFSSEERRVRIRAAGTKAWKRAFGEPYPEDKVESHMATRLYFDQVVQQIEDDAIETMKRRNTGLADTNSLLDKIAAFVLSLKR